MTRKTLPDENSTIPMHARPIVETVHHYFLSLPAGEQPPLDDPRAVAGLLASVLTREQILLLASCGYYPLPPEVIRLGCTLKEHQRKQTVKLIRGEMADQLPDAVNLLLENRI